MDIKPPGTENTPTSSASSTRPEAGSTLLRSLPQNWQIGQILTAVVTGKSASGSLLLNIQGMDAEVAKPPPFPLPNGQRLSLELLAKQPLPLLQIRNPAELPPPMRSNDPAVVNQALRTSLPVQQPQAPLLANIHLLATTPPVELKLPPTILQLSKQLYQQIPTQVQLKETGEVEKQLKQAAPFLEASLARTLQHPAQQPAAQVRTTLLRLATQLQSIPLAPTASRNIANPTASLSTVLPPPIATPSSSASAPHSAYLGNGQPVNSTQGQTTGVRQAPQPQAQSNASLLTIASQENGMEELLRQVEGVLARVQVQQMQSLHAENQGRTLWAMELPIRNEQGIDVFDFRIERDPHNKGEAGTQIPWTVSLAFELNGLGPVRAVISLQNETIATRFWAEEEVTTQLFNQYLDKLRSQLSHVGLNVGLLECRCGSPPPADPDSEPKILDEKV